MNKPTVIAAVLALSMAPAAFAQTSPSQTSPSQTPPSTTPRSAPPPAAAPGGGSGTSAPQRELTEADVKTGLEKMGFSPVTDVKKGPNGFTAKAMHSGQPVTLEIDRSGRVSQKD